MSAAGMQNQQQQQLQKDELLKLLGCHQHVSDKQPYASNGDNAVLQQRRWRKDTMNAKSAHVVLLTGIFLLMLMDMASAVKCYICSWNPRDYDNDTCTTDNFNPQRTRTDECDAGCETVIMRDSNGETSVIVKGMECNVNAVANRVVSNISIWPSENS
ncbi:uncharacterized protein LOC124723042 isoform X2 [Schistocerca piceifrons]|uniref:uncharacterized protein LOC124723042 isoform X2 n=1 Tax=Schistocerca piceifrons TaxID=274613 RepID=UPI001F5F62FE|nr:uncharacterized protein LOC124723042 isoform X2 [Schistocerca piceifrons]